MKHLSILSLFALMSLVLIGCSQETTKINNSNSGQDNYCINNPSAYGCGNANSCTNPTINDKTCENYCSVHPTGPGCIEGINCNIYPQYIKCGGNNPNPPHNSRYVEKNWLVHYPYVPTLNCPEAKRPTGIEYTPYETRKGTITLKGQTDYDPSSGQAFFSTTSELLQSKDGAMNFFWGDSTLKVRFKANLQPEVRNTTDVCPGRERGMSTMKGYGRIKFDVHLVGTRSNGIISKVSLGQRIIDINKCSPSIDLSSYAEEFAGGIYLEISNVQSNQNAWTDSKAYDLYGFIYPQNSQVENTWGKVRKAECWSLDIEVAADGTKTFD